MYTYNYRRLGAKWSYRPLIQVADRTLKLLGDDIYFSITIPVSTKHLYNMCTMLDQRRRRWAYVVQMLYKCFVFAGIII